MACDKNYAPYYGVLLTSLFVNNKDNYFHIHWITDDTIPQWTKDKIVRLISDNHSKLSVYKIDKSKLTDFPQHGHINYAAYYNLNIAKILPPDIHRIIYMDGDMIVHGDIRPLWDMDLKDNICAMALGPVWKDEYEYSRLGYDSEYGYYNNGVIVYDLDKLREFDFSIKALEYVSTHGDILNMMDQDVICVLLKGKILRLPLRYNFQMKFYWKWFWKKYDMEFHQWLIEEARVPVIIHYADKRKPWQLAYKKWPYTNLWYRYYKLSPWKGIVKIGPWKELIKRFLKPGIIKNTFAEEALPILTQRYV
jgi:lipopolysaccharide biosynthesis glycosyltransferase